MLCAQESGEGQEMNTVYADSSAIDKAAGIGLHGPADAGCRRYSLL